MNTIKYKHFENDPWGIHRKLVDLVPIGSTVLDVGCATGAIAKQLSGKNCRVTGVELNPKAARKASRYCRDVLIGDIENPAIVNELKRRQFDIIICADVLEHLKNPAPVLKRLAATLTVSGRLIVSLPNVVFITNRLQILLGRFDYTATGIMDGTHLRFYTKRSAETLLKNAGLEIVYFDAVGNFTQLPLYLQTVYPIFGKYNWWRTLEYWMARAWPQGLSIQFLYVCKKERG